MIETAVFSEKLNKVEGKVYVIEEEIKMPESGIYDNFLIHDNINDMTLSVYTGPKLTGDPIKTYVLSTPSLMPWKRSIRIQTEEPVVYVCYETDGDTVEAEDINRIQEEVVRSQEAINEENGRALNKEQSLEKAINDEIKRAQKKEVDLQKNINDCLSQLNDNMKKLQDADTQLDQKKANTEEVNRELSNRYTKEQVYTKEEVDQKVAESSGGDNYEHPNSGVKAGTYRSVTVNEQGHVTAGSNPTTLGGYGITDAAAKNHNHDGVYIKKGALTWGDLKGDS